MDKLPLFIAIWVACPFAGAAMGHMMKARAVVGFLFGFAFGLVGLVILHFIPSHLRTCQYCKKRVGFYAVKCSNCGSDFNNPGEPGIAYFDEKKPIIGVRATSLSR